MIPIMGAVAVIATVLTFGTTSMAKDPSSEGRAEDVPHEAAAYTKLEHTITRALDATLGTDAWPITVEVDGRTVTLRGWVDTLEEKRTAERVVLAVPSVRHVINVLDIDAGGHRRDAQLQARVEAALLDSPRVRGYEVDVHVDNGTVHLQGQVASPLEKQRAGDLARSVPGVRRVVDGLVAPTTWTWERDWQVRQNIEWALGERHPGLRKTVSVTVRKGVATLEGRVGSPDERGALEHLARRSGARMVHNRLSYDDSRAAGASF